MLLHARPGTGLPTFFSYPLSPSSRNTRPSSHSLFCSTTCPSSFSSHNSHFNSQLRLASRGYLSNTRSVTRDLVRAEVRVDGIDRATSSQSPGEGAIDGDSEELGLNERSSPEARNLDSPEVGANEGVSEFEGKRIDTGGMSWLGQVFSRKSKEEEEEEAEEKVHELIETVREAENKRLDNEVNLERLAETQLERDYMQQTMWKKNLLKLQGKLRGSPWDPLPGEDIPFSSFSQLLEQNRVQYMDYGEFGRHVAVLLPYYEELEVDSTEAPGEHNSQVESLDPAPELFPEDTKKIVFKRHVVDQMPADGWNDIWRQLHTQLVHVNVVHPNSLPMQIYPTIEVTLVWAMRLLLATTIYKFLDSWLYPIYKMRNPEDRPIIRRPKLSNIENSELGALGQSRARFISAEESTGVTFDDFAGQEYVKRELQEVVRILKDAKEFEDLGIYCPKGVLLYGPPGTGKTLLAKAIAGEAGVPFFSASGSEFVEMFVGVAAARVRDLFTRARQFAPSIVFIDEIDAIGAKRGGPDVGGGGVEREQGLIQILTELDGFQSQGSKVLVVGATNRLDMLDAALLRKGRFDKTISIGLPSEEGRLAILKVHARNKGFNSEREKEELLKELASITFDYSGAELQNVLNEAAILAARRDKDIIERAELLEAIKRQSGEFATGEEDVVDASGEARLRIAYREAAMAVLECSLPNPHRPFVKTNIRDIDSYPNMEYNDSRYRVFARKSSMIDSIVRACAPRLVEDMIFGRDNLSWLSGTALSEAGLLADYMILRTGMTALGKIYYRTQQDIMIHIGPKVQALRDEYMRFAVEKCSSVLREYRSALETIAVHRHWRQPEAVMSAMRNELSFKGFVVSTERLLEKEEVSAPEIWDIFSKAPRIPQAEVMPVNEHGALMYAGRWGIHGVSLPGRVTFSPGNVGWVTFGAPRPQQLKVISNETWKMLDKIRDENLAEIAKRGEDDEEEVGDVIFPQQFL